MTWTCTLCGDHHEQPVEHLRRMHPDVDAVPDVWPDGAVVVIDTTLTPEDFHS